MTNLGSPETARRFNKEEEEENGKEPIGENAITGPGADMASGFGGLGLEGIVGNEDSVGESSEPPGEGNRGVMSFSGELAGDGEAKGESGNNEGAAEIVEAGNVGCCGREIFVVLAVIVVLLIMKHIKTKRNCSIFVESIFNDEEINCLFFPLLGTEINI